MKLVNPRSLAATLDSVNDAFFHGRSLSKQQKEAVAKWIAGRQGLPGSYAGMFAATERDVKEGMTVFTGEKVRPGAATRHILGEEACRALMLLGVSLVGVRDALKRASAGMIERLRQASRRPSGIPGTYCCGICTCSLWRHLAVGGLEKGEQWLAAGMKALKQHRLDNGKWRRFPFYYTLLALSEIELPTAVEEMRYAAPACERSMKRSHGDDRFTQRRRLLMERILGRC
jgi:hypothetical protein